MIASIPELGHFQGMEGEEEGVILVPVHGTVIVQAYWDYCSPVVGGDDAWDDHDHPSSCAWSLIKMNEQLSQSLIIKRQRKTKLV